MARKGLLVVDMQNGFCHADGSFARMGLRPEGAQAAVRNAAVAVERARRAAIPVVFTRHVYRPGRADEGASLILNSPELAALNGLAAGYWDAEVVDELGCGPEDLVVDKVRFDAFQWTSLEPLLRGLGVSELVVCGVITNLCVESTVRSAFMRDFPVTLLADCCAARTRRLHELSIEVLTSYALAEIASVTEGFDFSPPAPPLKVVKTALGALGWAPYQPRHQPPAEQEQAEKRQRDQDERERGALPGHHPQHHAQGDRAEPRAHSRREQPEGPPPRPGRQPAGTEPGQERPRRRRDAGQALALGVASPPDDDEYQHAAAVEEHRQPGRTHGLHPSAAARSLP
jgi:nicotinamidase-related amidase